MKRILLTIAYEGKNYAGFQRQNNAITIQQRIEEALLSLTEETSELIGGSRTDAGVHALGNIAVFDTESLIPGDKFSFALNRHLPEDIRIMSSREVESDFHPHRITTKKSYRYRILRASIQDPLRRNFTWQIHRNLDVKEMQKAIAFLVGEHDFSSFCAAGSQVNSKIRTIYSAQVIEKEDELWIEFCSNGLLYNMVRIIAGTVVDAGLGKWEPAHMEEIIEGKDRGLAGPTAPAKGLLLVGYLFPD